MAFALEIAYRAADDGAAQPLIRYTTVIPPLIEALSAPLVPVIVTL